MDLRRGRSSCARAALAGSLLFGVTLVAFASWSLPAPASPTYTPAVTDTIAVGSDPYGVAVDQDTGTVYVANKSYGYAQGTVSVISEATDTVTHTVTVGEDPFGVAVDQDTGTVYVTNLGGESVSVISEATDTVTHTVTVGSDPGAVAVDQDTGTVYVANLNDNTVSVISVATDTVTHTIAVGSQPGAVAVDPDTGTVYVANENGNTVSVVSVATDTVTDTIAVGSGPSGVAVDPDTGTIYVANDGSNTLSVISEATNTVTDTIAVGDAPFGVAVDPDTGTVYVANLNGYTVSIISEATDTVTDTVAVGSYPIGVAVDPNTDTVYVTNSGSNTVSVITEIINDDYSYAAGGGTGTAPASGSGLDGTTITLADNTFTYPGYTFAGWSDGTDTYVAGATYTLSSDGSPIVFTAQWTENTIDTVSFVSDGGAAVASLSGPDGSSITLPSDTYPGYSFDGWFTQESGGTEVGGAGSSYTIPAGGVTLDAHWTAIDTVAFNSNGGAAVCFAERPRRQLDHPAIGHLSRLQLRRLVHPSERRHRGRRCRLVLHDPLGRHHPLRPLDRVHTVAFDSNGGAAVASLSGPAGSSITLPADTYPGYSFDGWFTQESGGTEVGGAGSSYTIPLDGITLDAHWTENAVDTVAFNSNGGAAVASLSGPDGSSITLPSDTYPGYSFDGWFTQASGGTEVGGAGSSYTIPSGGITLYAHWTSIAQPPSPSPPPPAHGYWLVGSDGGIFTFGSAQFYGSTGASRSSAPSSASCRRLTTAATGSTPPTVGSSASATRSSTAPSPASGLHPAGSGLPNSLNAPIVGMVPSIDDGGYFMVASDGGVFAFGDAHFAGSCPGIGGCSGAAVAVMPDAQRQRLLARHLDRQRLHLR